MIPDELRAMQDPRVFLKNFGMPMNPGVRAEPAFGQVRRKDGAEIPKRVPSLLAGIGGNGGVATRPREIDKVPPLFPTLIRREDGSRYVTVTEGVVGETIPSTAGAPGGEIYDGFGDDGYMEHAVTNIWDEEHPNLLRVHGPMTIGQVIGVAFDVDRKGYLTAKPGLEIRDFANAKSLHFKPPVGADPGAAGNVFVILAKLVQDGDNSDKLQIHHGGSNIDYTHDTPPFIKVGSGENIFYRYNLETGEYEYYGLLGISPVKVELNGLNVEFSLEGADLDLDIYTFELKNILNPTYISLTIPEQTITTAKDGAHKHSFQDMIEGGGAYIVNETGFPVGSEDGEHQHTFTVPSQIVSTSIDVPIASIEASTTFDRYCWRNGVFAGIFANGGSAPEVTGGDVPFYSKTLYVWEGPNPDALKGGDLMTVGLP